VCPDSRGGATGSIVFPAKFWSCFGLALVSGLLSMPPCLPSAMGLFTLCSFLVDFTGSHSKELTLSLRGDFELRLLKNVGTV
jgi:hypothetical protein